MSWVWPRDGLEGEDGSGDKDGLGQLGANHQGNGSVGAMNDSTIHLSKTKTQNYSSTIIST